jgi:hypothetical protein
MFATAAGGTRFLCLGTRAPSADWVFRWTGTQWMPHQQLPLSDSNASSWVPFSLPSGGSAVPGDYLVRIAGEDGGSGGANNNASVAVVYRYTAQAAQGLNNGTWVLHTALPELYSNNATAGTTTLTTAVRSGAFLPLLRNGSGGDNGGFLLLAGSGGAFAQYFDGSATPPTFGNSTPIMALTSDAASFVSVLSESESGRLGPDSVPSVVAVGLPGSGNVSLFELLEVQNSSSFQWRSSIAGFAMPAAAVSFDLGTSPSFPHNGNGAGRAFAVADAGSAQSRVFWMPANLSATATATATEITPPVAVSNAHSVVPVPATDGRKYLFFGSAGPGRDASRLFMFNPRIGVWDLVSDFGAVNTAAGTADENGLSHLYASLADGGNNAKGGSIVLAGG